MSGAKDRRKANGVDPVQLLGLSPFGVQLVEELRLFSVDLIILMPIRITRVKNIDFALHVADLLKQSGRTLRLIVTGPPDPHVPEIQRYYAGLLELRDKLSLQNEVIFLHEGIPGHPPPLSIDEAAIGELYRISDLVLMPSLREGFGMPVLEGGLVDRPVFATPIPATREFPGFPYLIGLDESAESVAGRIRAWADADNRHALRRQIRRDFTWSAIFSRNILPLIQVTAAPKTGPSS